MGDNILAVTMGCPVGIGPEIIIRFHEELFQRENPGGDSFQPVVCGDPGVLSRCAASLGFEGGIEVWQPGREPVPGVINVWPLSELPDDLCWGEPTPATGRAMGRYIEEAARLIGEGGFAGMVTCPITKSSLNAAGFKFPGHTEMLASLTGAGDYLMMMAGSRLRVTLVTIHVGLAEVPGLLNSADVLKVITMTGEALRRDFGIGRPRLLVSGLNPHAGEGGMFGEEEGVVIAPAVDQARRLGWEVNGPFPPDTVFNRAGAGEADAVVCMYHDQGLIPFKLLHFEDGVNVTLGLPLVRTSVDHGTAYDIAGRGVGSCRSLREAFRLAGRIVVNRRRFAENS